MFLSVLPLPQETAEATQSTTAFNGQNSCTVLQSATEAVLEDRTQSSPTPGKAVWAGAGTWLGHVLIPVA